LSQELDIGKLKSKIFKYITTILLIFIAIILYIVPNTHMVLTISVLLFIFTAHLVTMFFLNKFSKKVDTFYTDTIEKIKFSEGYLKAVENSSSNIIITSLDKKLYSANKAFYDFSGFKDLQDFKKEHECICDIFVTRKGYLQKLMDGLIWMEYIAKYPGLSHKAIMLKDGVEHIFQVTSSSLNIDEKYRKIATFVDITELENLKDRYQFAINGTQDGLWDWDLKTNNVYFSPQWKKQLGYSNNELQNEFKTWEDRVHPEDLESATEDITANIDRKTDFYENIHRLKHKDGSWVWILDRGQTIFNEDGEAIRMVGFHTDITKHKELETKLYEQSEILKEAQHLAHIGSWEIYAKDNKAICSNEIYNIFEIDTGTLINSYDQFRDTVYKEDMQKVQTAYEKSIENKTNYTIIYRIQTKKTKKIKYVEDRCEHIYNLKGELVKSIGSIQDITQQYKSQLELLKLKAVIEQSPLSIVITDIRGKIEYVNPGFCTITGYSYSEAIGENPNILKSGFTTKEQYKKLWETIRSNKIWTGTFKNKRKNGDFYWETITIVPINNEKEEIINYVGIKQEITKEVVLEQEIKEQEKIMIAQSRHAAMGEMISMIAHQWRQPLSVISMASNNILADIELECVDNESLKEVSLEIIEQTLELSKTIDDFRNFFKPNKSTEAIFIKNIFDEVFHIMGKSLENHEVKVIKEFHNSKKINTYSRELMQVLINIIKNAKEALVDNNIQHKQIIITIEENQENIIIKIQDNAGGIKEDIMYRIFEPYFSTKNEKSGTGLGLYMSKTIIEKHLRGTIDAYNKDEGACFHITLPYSI
jgi:PAS domain S-box-containing protein